MALCVPLDLASKVNFKMMPAKYHIPASFSSAQVNRGATVPCFETVRKLQYLPLYLIPILTPKSAFVGCCNSLLSSVTGRRLDTLRLTSCSGRGKGAQCLWRAYKP
ncbi:hypothetical protein BKA60DRAFT_570274 [Fusarium oxysporum]|nr:hypothetical protein BKA60DRAFT_570274 [Fusarium oxysporum]